MEQASNETIQRLKRAGVALRCPICASPEFAATNPDEEKILALPYEDASASWFGPPLYMQVKRLGCAFCGYVLLFQRHTDVRANTAQ